MLWGVPRRLQCTTRAASQGKLGCQYGRTEELRPRDTSSRLALRAVMLPCCHVAVDVEAACLPLWRETVTMGAVAGSSRIDVFVFVYDGIITLIGVDAIWRPVNPKARFEVFDRVVFCWLFPFLSSRVGRPCD